MQLLFQASPETDQSMPKMPEAEQQSADRRCDTGSKRSGVPVAPDRTNAPQWTADPVSVRLLMAHEQHQDVAVLSVHGEIDLESAPVLRKFLLPVLEHQTGPVVVDLSEVAFMDSTGLHVLVDTLRRLEPQNRRLAIVCREGGQAHRLLALVGLLDALTVHRSRESAVIGGDDLLRSDPGRNSGPSDKRAPTQTLLSAGQTPEC
jgi:anti-sigma B factor antagonist